MIIDFLISVWAVMASLLAFFFFMCWTCSAEDKSEIIKILKDANDELKERLDESNRLLDQFFDDIDIHRNK